MFSKLLVFIIVAVLGFGTKLSWQLVTFSISLNLISVPVFSEPRANLFGSITTQTLFFLNYLATDSNS
jgi:hypothetical protein